MTGFGRGAAAGENFSVAVDVKTVNNRFLDIHLRASAELSGLEATLRRRVGERLSRGRVDISVTLERTGEVLYELNRPLISGFVRAMQTLKEEFSLTGEPDINVLARLPGAMQPARDGLSEEMLGASSARSSSFDELEVMREREGAALRRRDAFAARRDLEGHVADYEVVAGGQLVLTAHASTAPHQRVARTRRASKSSNWIMDASHRFSVVGSWIWKKNSRICRKLVLAGSK